MEKRKPHYSLADIKAEFSSVQTLRITVTARDCAFRLGFVLQDVVDLIQEITSEHFFKSMTSEANHTIWQDVYHVPCSDENGDDITLYVKFTKDDTGHLLISFKEKE